ncbi:MAG: DNA (cytosine-5-)-methyltransferase [Caldilineaceae bacterium]|nr:DNA (cytosine-5-)-methyltransferase [Caldilineaceae bacterium]
MDIRTLRQSRNIRLRDLAKLLDVTQYELSKYERGLVLPNAEIFSRLAEIFQLEPSLLISAQKDIERFATPGEGYTTANTVVEKTIHPSEVVRKNSIRIMDLFCGTGGFSHGFEQTGAFQVTLGIDLLNDRIETFHANHPGSSALAADIRGISFEKLNSLTDKPDVIIGGPPCQGFSSIRPFRTLTEEDRRNNLYESFALISNYYRPDWFILENVVGLLTHKGRKTFKTIIQLFEQIGYTTSWKVLNAALYGLPQRRERLIIIGNKHGKIFHWPAATHYFNGRSMAGDIHGQKASNLPLFGEELQYAVTVMEAIHDLPEIESGCSSNEYRTDTQLTDYERQMRGNNNRLTLHESTKHSSKMLEIIRNAGHNRSALPEGMTTSGFSSSYSRLEPDLPSVTLTVNFVHPASNKCIHPYQDRALTPREGARLQGFEDRYYFAGNRTQVVKQIGNAVPPLLGKVIAESLIDQL